MTESKEVIIMSKRSASYSDDDDEPQHFMPAPSSVPDTVFDRIRLMEEMYRQENTRTTDDYYDRPVSPRTHRRNIISAAERESKRLASDARLWQASMGDPTRQLALYLDNYDEGERVGYDALKILALLESGADPVAYRGSWKDTILHSISEWSSPTGSNLVEILEIFNLIQIIILIKQSLQNNIFKNQSHKIILMLHNQIYQEQHHCHHHNNNFYPFNNH